MLELVQNDLATPRPLVVVGTGGFLLIEAFREQLVVAGEPTSTC